MKILVVEDEKSIRKFIKINLERENYQVFEVESGEEALELIENQEIHMVILDLMLPGMDGYQVCESLRKKDQELGIIMLTAKSQDMDKIMGLEYGADDYMTKPFNPKELVLRIRSLERRLEIKSYDKLKSFGPFSLDLYSRSLRKNEEYINLTPTEYSIIKLFIENPGKAFSRDEILNMVWGYEFIGDSKIVDVNIRRLRSKIEEDSRNPIYIETVWGVGYRWKEKE